MEGFLLCRWMEGLGARSSALGGGARREDHCSWTTANFLLVCCLSGFKVASFTCTW
jgi:hypothetical protein